MKLPDFLKKLFDRDENAPIPMQCKPDIPPTKSLHERSSAQASAARVPAKTTEPAHFEMRDLDDAKAFFFSNRCGDPDRMGGKYDAATLAAFNALADRNQLKLWSEEYCLARLQSIIDGDITDCQKKLNDVIGLRRYWGSIAADGYMTQFLQAWKVIFVKDPNAAKYLESMRTWLKFADYRNDALFRWMEHAEQLLRTERPEDYAKAGYSTPMYDFKEQIRELRGARLEREPVDGSAFRFVRMPQELVDAVFTHYSEQYGNNPEALRSSFAGFHFGFCVQNAEFYLTGASDAAESWSHQSWDHYHFLIVSADFSRIAQLECVREQTSGRFFPKACPDWLDAQAVSDAVTLYRNQPARKQFEAELRLFQPQVQLYDLHEEGKQALYARIPKVFDYLKERLAGNPLAETLGQLIDFCEEYAPEYNGMEFGEPVPQERIDAWEQHRGITLPEDYKHFLRFADGASIPSCNAEIRGLDGICDAQIDEYLEEGYHYMGSIIGDGAMIVFRASDGAICEEDHGEIMEFGGMTGLLEWIMDMI